MKQPIAMRCNKKQFNEILPKIKHLNVSMSEDFEINPYLTNNLGGELRVGNLGEYHYRIKECKVYEEWNEKIFLEACGIEVENSKHPSLEEVKEYFKNAKTVISCYGENTELSEIVQGVDQSYKDKETGCTVYDDNTGKYAEILTYKEKTFSITESQIKKLEETETIYEKDSLLHRLFPEAFESDVKEIQLNTWYKSTEFNQMIIFVESQCENGHLFGYGFDKNGQFTIDRNKDNIDWCLCNSTHKKHLIEATEQEVFEALKNEAVKRGFKEGCYFVEPKNQLIHDSRKRLAKGSIELFGDEMNKLCFKNSDSLIYREGIWGEAFESITLSEAEQQLGKKIIV